MAVKFIVDRGNLILLYLAAMQMKTPRPAPAVEYSNQLKEMRTKRGLSQGDLAREVSTTRQAISAIESNLYLPSTAIALRLAGVLGCRVEDLFSLAPTEDILEGRLIGWLPEAETATHSIRVKVSTVGKRTIVRPVADLGEQLCFAVPADGYLTDPEPKPSGASVRVKLSRDRVVRHFEFISD